MFSLGPTRSTWAVHSRGSRSKSAARTRPKPRSTTRSVQPARTGGRARRARAVLTFSRSVRSVFPHRTRTRLDCLPVPHVRGRAVDDWLLHLFADVRVPQELVLVRAQHARGLCLCVWLVCIPFCHGDDGSDAWSWRGPTGTYRPPPSLPLRAPPAPRARLCDDDAAAVHQLQAAVRGAHAVEDAHVQVPQHHHRRPLCVYHPHAVSASARVLPRRCAGVVFSSRRSTATSSLGTRPHADRRALLVRDGDGGSATSGPDIIFIIYIYQRWSYPTDMSRVNEFGQGGTDDDDDGNVAASAGAIAAGTSASAGAAATPSGDAAASKKNQ